MAHMKKHTHSHQSVKLMEVGLLLLFRLGGIMKNRVAVLSHCSELCYVVMKKPPQW